MHAANFHLILGDGENSMQKQIEVITQTFVNQTNYIIICTSISLPCQCAELSLFVGTFPQIYMYEGDKYSLSVPGTWIINCFYASNVHEVMGVSVIEPGPVQPVLRV